jgi:hypothetical protein
VALEGELIVRIDWRGRSVRQVTVRSTRPMIAARALAGKTAADTAAMVPRLFSICSGAQGAAAAGALGAAGASGQPFESGSRDCEVMLEALQDTLWHLLIDWPNTMGSAPCTTAVAAARFQIASAMRATDGTPRFNDAVAMRELGVRLSTIAAKAIFGMPPTAWLELANVDALEAWCSRRETVPALLLGQVLAGGPTLGRSTTPLMPAALREELLRVIVPALRDDPTFALAPAWAGAPVETGGLARMRNKPLVRALQEKFGNAVVTRIVARLTELALLMLELTGIHTPTDMPPRVQRLTLGEGEGLAAVETARGLLLHRACVRGQRVVDYQIVAPTEWNFHPGGALASGLEGLEAEDEQQLIRSTRLAVHALDPCVAYRVEVGHA